MGNWRMLCKGSGRSHKCSWDLYYNIPCLIIHVTVEIHKQVLHSARARNIRTGIRHKLWALCNKNVN
jgi:hypothetical protein